MNALKAFNECYYNNAMGNELESIIMTSPEFAYRYANCILGVR